MLDRVIALTLILVSVVGGANAAAQPCPSLVKKWGENGSGPGQFGAIFGMGMDLAGNIYVADGANAVVHKFSNDGIFLESWGQRGTGIGQFNYPKDVAISESTGEAFVTDPSLQRVQVFDQSHQFLRTLNITAESISLDPTGVYLFGTSWPGKLTKYMATDGTQLGEWYYDGEQRYKGYGFAVGQRGAVYIASSVNDEVCALFSPLGCWGDYTVFASPGPVAIDRSEGLIYVGDFAFLWKFDQHAQLVCQWSSRGTGDDQFSDVADDILVDGGGSVFVLDTSLSRIQKFAYPPTPTRASSWGRLKLRYR